MADSSLTNILGGEKKKSVRALLAAALGIVCVQLVFFSYQEVRFEYIGTVTTYQRYRRPDGTYIGSDKQGETAWFFHEQPIQMGNWIIELYQDSSPEIPVDYEEYSYISVTGYTLEQISINRWCRNAKLDAYIPRVVLADRCSPNAVNYYRIKKKDHIRITPYTDYTGEPSTSKTEPPVYKLSNRER